MLFMLWAPMTFYTDSGPNLFLNSSTFLFITMLIRRKVMHTLKTQRPKAKRHEKQILLHSLSG